MIIGRIPSVYSKKFERANEWTKHYEIFHKYRVNFDNVRWNNVIHKINALFISRITILYIYIFFLVSRNAILDSDLISDNNYSDNEMLF